MMSKDMFEQLSAYLDGELSPQEVVEIEKLLESSAQYRKLLAQLQGLSGDLQDQDFPDSTSETVALTVARTLEQLHQEEQGWWRRLLELPMQQPSFRLVLQLVLNLVLPALSALGLLALAIMPEYVSTQPSSITSFEFANRLAGLALWLSDHSELLAWLPLLVPLLLVVLGGWAHGGAELLTDLWHGHPLQASRLMRFGVGMVWLAPLAGLPLLLTAAGRYYLAFCCAWVGLWLMGCFLLTLLRARRPLPACALDFVVMLVLLSGLEWLARRSPQLSQRLLTLGERLPEVVGAQWWFFSSVLLVVAVATLLTLLGIALPPYRGRSGGRLSQLLLLLIGLLALVGLGQRVSEVQATTETAVAARETRSALLLADSPDNRWLVAQLEYNGVISEAESQKEWGWNSAGRHRERAVDAFLDWDERRLLEELSRWSQRAPGPLQGFHQYLSLLGEPGDQTLNSFTLERAKTLKEISARLHWRGQQEVQLEIASGAVKGTVVLPGLNVSELPVRLIPCDDTATALAQLKEEARLPIDPLAATLSLDTRNFFSTLELDENTHSARFGFEGVPPGRYLLALLVPPGMKFTSNASLPQVFEVKRSTVDLGTVVLTRPDAQIALPLESRDWKTRGKVSFQTGEHGPYVRLSPSGELSQFVDLLPYQRRSLRLQAALRGEARLKAVTYAKDGRVLATEESKSVNGKAQLDLLVSPGSGYVQVVVAAEEETVVVDGIQMEVLSDGQD